MLDGVGHEGSYRAWMEAIGPFLLPLSGNAWGEREKLKMVHFLVMRLYNTQFADFPIDGEAFRVKSCVPPL